MTKATHPISGRLALTGVLLLLFPGCLECAEEACEAAKAPYGRAAIDQGVAGVVAYRTDSCANDCCECSESAAMLEIYPLTAPVTDAAGAQAIVARGSAPIRLNAQKRYERTLDAGDYLLCTHSRCAALHIDEGSVITANVQLRYGPPSIHVFGPGDREPREELVFEVDDQAR